jgi:hypothetical protein
MIGFGDTLFLKAPITAGSSAIFPSFAYEFINKSRITFDFQMYKENINTEVHESSPFLIADPNSSIKTMSIAKKWRKAELNFEKQILKQKLISLSVSGGLGFLRQRKNKLKEQTSDPLNRLENEFNTKFNGTGSFVTGTIGLSVKRKRLSLNIDFGRTLLNFKKQEDFISGIVYNQVGLKYDFYYKTLVVDQRKKEQMNNTGLKEYYRFEVGLLINYTAIKHFKQTGSQVYLNDATAYIFSEKPELKASPEFGAKSRWLPKNSLFSINAIFSRQVLSVKYTDAKKYLSDETGFVNTIDIKTKISKYLFSLGIERKFETSQRLKPFAGIYIGFNYMKTNPLLVNIELNSPSTVYNYNRFRSAMFAYTGSLGFNYKRFDLALNYSLLAGRFNNSDNYVLSNLGQLQMTLTMELFKIK